MAQGAIKKSNKATSSSKRPKVLGPKRGPRQIAPKKAKLAQQKKMLKKHTAGLTALTEQRLAAKAGHLEMVQGGKKDAKGKNAKQSKEKRQG